MVKNDSSKSMIQIIKELSETDISYLEIEVLQAIIKFKWEKYTRMFFFWQFLFLIVFFAIFITDMIFGSKDHGLSNENNEQLKGFIGTRVVCQVLILYFSYFEILHIIEIGFKEYISIIWNINDVCLIFTYTSYLVLSFV